MIIDDNIIALCVLCFGRRWYRYNVSMNKYLFFDSLCQLLVMRLEIQQSWQSIPQIL